MPLFPPPPLARFPASEHQHVLLHDQLPHDLRHLLRGLYPALPGVASDAARVAVHVRVRVHEPP